MTIIYFILLLSIIICLHEAGHLWAAKKFNVYCYEYSFGMGPVIWKKQTEETQYSIRAIPVGGFVAMAGEVEGDEAYPGVVVPDERRLTNQKPWKKIIIMLAGVFMNFVLAWFLFSMIILHNGVYHVSPKPVIKEVMEDSPAALAGFEANDLVLVVESANGPMKPESYSQLQLFLAQATGEEMHFVVERDGKEVELNVTPKYNEDLHMYLIGIMGEAPIEKKVTFLNSFGYGAKDMKTYSTLMWNVFKNLFKGSGAKELGGPIAIYDVTKQTVNFGFFSYLFLIAQLSLNVGIFNLLPLPILDGGQVVLVLCEWIAGKPLNQKVRMYITYACWFLMLALMLFVTWNDITRYIIK